MRTPKKSGRVKTRHWFLLALVAWLTSASVFSPAAQAAIGGSFSDNFDSFNSSRWSMADGYSNGGMFDAGWRADHVWFNGGVMGINLNTTPCPGGCSGKPYASGEYRTTDLYSYGRFETRMMAPRGRAPSLHSSRTPGRVTGSPGMKST